jgi:hypothetical protein
MVTGSRFLVHGGEGYRSSAGRRAGIRRFARVVSLTGELVTDPTSGFRMTNRRGIELFARDYPHNYPEVEAILCEGQIQRWLSRISLRRGGSPERCRMTVVDTAPAARKARGVSKLPGRPQRGVAAPRTSPSRR